MVLPTAFQLIDPRPTGLTLLDCAGVIMRDNQAVVLKAGLSQSVTCEVKTSKGFHRIAIAPRWDFQDERQLAPAVIGDVRSARPWESGRAGQGGSGCRRRGWW
jgi:hypothetical protein